MPKGDEIVGEYRIALIRKHKNIRLREIAENCELSITTINRYERGTRDPSLAHLRQIAAFLGVKTAELLPQKDTGLTDREWSIIRSLQS